MNNGIMDDDHMFVCAVNDMKFRTHICRCCRHEGSDKCNGCKRNYNDLPDLHEWDGETEQRLMEIKNKEFDPRAW